jgi:hypothetical protein
MLASYLSELSPASHARSERSVGENTRGLFARKLSDTSRRFRLCVQNEHWSSQRFDNLQRGRLEVSAYAEPAYELRRH